MESSISQLETDETYNAHEKKILKYWKDIDLYSKLGYVSTTDSQLSSFNFIDGPPFISSKNLHLGHLLVSTIKSSILNYKIMHGEKCTNKLGYDTHGLPSEMAGQKRLGISSVQEIESKNIGIAKFNEACKTMIHEYADSWTPIYEGIGRFIDTKNTYKTMDTPFMETIWYIFSKLYEPREPRELVYKSYKILPYSLGCQTSLSNFEAGQNYKELVTNSIYVYFPKENDPDTGFLAWTTTPWTLPKNVALCVNPTSIYIVAKMKKPSPSSPSFSLSPLCHYILSKNSLVHFKNLEIESEIGPGNLLVGTKYLPPFPHYPINYYQVISDDYVKDETSDTIGTGIVHIAPAHGEDDLRVSQKYRIISPENIHLIYEPDSAYPINFLDDADKNVIHSLKEKNILFGSMTFRHQYPFCDRSDMPLIYRLLPGYFIDVPSIRDEMIKLNEHVNWYPMDNNRTSVGRKRYENWVSNAESWNISRTRIFGTPIPIWESDDGTESVCVNSIHSLEELTGILSGSITDIHREFVDNLTIVSPRSGKILHRIPYVFDCWFESACVPFAQIHYPFEEELRSPESGEHYFDNHEYLCNFVAESFEQTKLWFYVMNVISTAILHKPAFHNAICSGLILDKTGKKLSKKLGNFVDPMELIERYGADSIRLYLLHSPASGAETLMFDENNVIKTKQNIIQYMNCVRFFLEYSIYFKEKLHSVDEELHCNHESLSLMDKWILQKIYEVRVKIEQHMEQYNVYDSVDEIIQFIELLTNWYLKLNRPRMKGQYGHDEQKTSLSVLYTVIYEFTILIAPFMPFISEHVFQHLPQYSDVPSDVPRSVHLAKYPVVVRTYGHEIVDNFEKLQSIICMVRALRDKLIPHNSVKIPIKNCKVHIDGSIDIPEFWELIQNEINSLTPIDVHDWNELSTHTEVKINERELGRKYRKNAGIMREKILKMTPEELVDSSCNIDSSCYTIVKTITSIDSDTTFVDEQNHIMVSIDCSFDQTIEDTFNIRKLISSIQNARKIAGLHPWNTVKIYYKFNEISTINNDLIVATIKKYDSELVEKLKANVIYDEIVHDETVHSYTFVHNWSITEISITIIW